MLNYPYSMECTIYHFPSNLHHVVEKVPGRDKVLSKKFRKSFFRVQRPKVDLRMNYYGLKQYGPRDFVIPTNKSLERNVYTNTCLA